MIWFIQSTVVLSHYYWNKWNGWLLSFSGYGLNDIPTLYGLWWLSYDLMSDVLQQKKTFSRRQLANVFRGGCFFWCSEILTACRISKIVGKYCEERWIRNCIRSGYQTSQQEFGKFRQKNWNFSRNLWKPSTGNYSNQIGTDLGSLNVISWS